jgi:thymidylate synthase
MLLFLWFFINAKYLSIKLVAKELTKSDVEKIVKDEIKSFVTNELGKEMAKAIKKTNSDPRKEVVEISKQAIEKLAEFLWIRRNIWKGDIK